MSDNTVSKDAIVVERIFNAPIELIWRMWTQPEHLKNWYGPQGFSIPVAQMDVRVGGKRLICMEAPDGSMKFWTAGEYTEIVPTTRLVYTEGMADEKGNILPFAEGMNDDDPTMTEITVLLEDINGRTKMVMTHAGVPAGEDGAAAGWEQAFSKMADYAETVLNKSN
jgi:uncharacterized protein YndB with AHSA1/START domain